jgi:hypothetical protein
MQKLDELKASSSEQELKRELERADLQRQLQQIAALPDEEYEAGAARVTPHCRELMDELRKRNQRAAVGVERSVQS